jgi:hypothetical protein
MYKYSDTIYVKIKALKKMVKFGRSIRSGYSKVSYGIYFNRLCLREKISS